MKKFFYIKLFLLKILFLVLSGVELAAFPYGWVRDYNRLTNSVTVIVTQAGAFVPGMTLHAFSGQKKVGSISVKMAFHSKILGSLTSGDNIKKGDMVIKNPADIQKLVKKELKKVSFQELALLGMSWIVKVNFSGASENIEPQIRKIPFPNTIGFRRKAQNFFETIPAKEIQKIIYLWEDNILKGQRIKPISGSEILCDEIISPGAIVKLKPPKKNRSQKITLTVELVKSKGMLDIRPDALPVELSIEFPKLVFGQWRYEKKFILQTGENYFLKVYSNSIFINDFLITHNQFLNETLNSKFFLQGPDIFPGNNELEFYIIGTEKIGNDFFEKGEARLIGKKVINYGNGLYDFSFHFIGKEGKFPVIQ